MAEIARANGISVSYAGAKQTVLSDVSFTVNSDEIFGLLGPNGAGKTTLIRTFCGRVTPSNGQLAVAGCHPGDAAYHHQIGLAPQDIALFSHMTAGENLTAFASMAGLRGKTRDTLVRETMAAIQIDAHHDTTVENLSGGWKRRVNIAAAMVHQPRLLILDEPTVGVDIRAQLAIEDAIRAYTKRGNAALITTHDMEQAERLCDRVGLLSGGRFVKIGAPDQLLKEHFADQKHLSLRLTEAASDHIATQLTTSGYQNADPTLWTRVLTGSGDAEIASARAIGVPLREVSLSAPNLGHLMQALTKTESGT
ncbi:MAG: ABC transporter ATP-binding protein [Marinosulfonomonas sp.]